MRQHYPNEPSIPAIAGASARFVASLSTAPLELLRTQQAARVGTTTSGASNSSATNIGITSEFRLMIQEGGISSLFRGVHPTLMRDIPFSAVYWLCIESMRDFWRNRRQQQNNNDNHTPALSAWEQGGQALINGSVSGIIAAAVTTPLDVIKTRIQVGGNTHKHHW